jgi:hypothetical protein
LDEKNCFTLPPPDGWLAGSGVSCSLKEGWLTRSSQVTPSLPCVEIVPQGSSNVLLTIYKGVSEV